MEEKYSAALTSIESLKERSQKVRALTDPDMRFTPFWSSSEWIQFDIMHPGVLAEKYNRSYRPCFMGRAVFVIYPQWYSTTFHTLFNNDLLTAFLENQSGAIASQYVANSLLKQNPRVPMKGIV